MAQSQNTKVDLQAKGVSYMGMGGKVGKFLVGDRAIEFYPDANVERFIQIPWEAIRTMGANVSRGKVSRHFEIQTEKSRFLFASKDSGKILKTARHYIGNEKVIKLPTLLQMISRKIRRINKK